MTDPAAFSRRILLAVTGLTPQIVTETLYALAVKGTPRWVPTGIRIITTRQGAEKAERMSLPAELRRLCGDYDLPEAAFGVEDIRIIKSPNGKPLDDILTARPGREMGVLPPVAAGRPRARALGASASAAD